MATPGGKLHLALVALLVASAAVVASSAPVLDAWSATAGARRLAEVEYDEFGLFSSESSSVRRFLSTSDYISYGALQKDRVPCSIPGQSYYNCKPSAQANPYTRGCSTVTNCR